MHIEIAERLRPFSHLPGSYVVLPGSSLRLHIFPTKVVIDELAGSVPATLAVLTFAVAGPLKDFTVVQDLEKGIVQVMGKGVLGHFRYCLAALAGGQGIALSFEKVPPPAIDLSCHGVWQLGGEETVKQGDTRLIGPSVHGAVQPKSASLLRQSLPLIDRLSLGNHKAQDWALMRRRLDFSEIFPLWHRLGQLVTNDTPQTSMGTASLLEECRAAICANAPEHILPHFQRLFLTGFDGALSPRLEDSDFHGLALPEIDRRQPASPLQLLQQGAELIRSLFIKDRGDSLELLPALPPQFHCGRLLNVAGGQGIVSLEWTKKAIRCAILHATKTGRIALACADGAKHCRLRLSNHDRGCRYLVAAAIDVVAGQDYWFDNFEH